MVLNIRRGLLLILAVMLAFTGCAVQQGELATTTIPAQPAPEESVQQPQGPIVINTPPVPTDPGVKEQAGVSGSIDWSGGYLEAVGIGVPPEKFAGRPQARPMALRAAQLDAYRNLLEVVQGVRVDSSTTVKDFAVENDLIRTQVEGVVKGAQTVRTDYKTDGTVEITMRMPLFGGLAQVVLPKAPEPKPISPAFTEKAYTGLVVDARGLGARPAMAPRLLDDDGSEVYGSAYVSREFAIQQGMSGYAKNLAAAQANDRVAADPLTIKGVKAHGPGRSDIVLSDADAAVVRDAAETQTFLRQCRVMIVLD